VGCRGFVKYNLKDYNGASADMDTAIRYEPLCGECYKVKAMVARDIGKKACDDFEKAVYWGYQEFNELIQKYCKQ